MQPLLEVDQLCVEFTTRHGSLRALSDVSFGIAPGEVLGIVGESGAGKSLTGAAIIGLLQPPGRISGGRIVYDGQRIEALPDDAMRRLRGRQIGSIFQDPMTALNPLHRVGDQVAEVFHTHTKLAAAAVRARVQALFEQVGLPDPPGVARAYVHQLSGGQRQRVGIAMALALEPDEIGRASCRERVCSTV